MKHVQRVSALSCAPTAAALAIGLSIGAGEASAWLGGFENADGYEPFLNRVQEYNAGQYGASSGYLATSPTSITPNTGLWQALSGGFTSGGATSYATGHQNFDRTFVNTSGASGAASDQGLVLTTGHEGWTGPALQYQYNLDSQDLGGVNPASTGGQTINLSFWWCAELPGPELGGSLADGYFGDEIAFMDASGDTGFVLGLTQRSTGDKVTYWDGSSMVESSIVAASSRFDRWDISLDLANDTFSASYFSFQTSTTHNLVTNASMMSAMDEFTAMTFRTSPGVTNAKLMAVDDFSITTRRIPAPGAAAVFLLGGAAGALRRRR